MATPQSPRRRAWDHAPLRVKGLLVVAPPILALLLVGALVVAMLEARELADLRLAEAYRVEADLQALGSIALDAASSANAFLLTRDDKSLAPLSRAEATLPEVLARLRGALSGDAGQLARLERAEAQFEQQFSALRWVLYYAELFGDDQPELINGLVSTSQVVMQGLSLQTDELLASHRRLVSEREAARSAAWRRSTLSAILALLAGAAAGVVGALLHGRAISERVLELRTDARRLAQGLPPVRRPETRDEIGDLAAALREAAARLSAREAQLRQANAQVRERLEEAARRERAVALVAIFGAEAQRARSAEAVLEALRAAASGLGAGMSGTVRLEPSPPGVEGGEALLPRGARVDWGPAPPLPSDFPPPPQLRGETILPTLLRFPVDAGERRYGEAFLHSPDGIDADARRTMGALIDRAALALDSLRLRWDLEERARRDGLTGLFNRRHLDAFLARSVQEARVAGEPLSIIVADLDHFKQLNDHRGHEAGDEVLRAFARLLRASFRERDVACRYGGEEFVVVLPGVAPAEARARAEALAERVRELRIPIRGGTLEMISVSMGVAGIPEHADAPDDLVRRADEALYLAKGGGRDRVVLASERPPSR